MALIRRVLTTLIFLYLFTSVLSYNPAFIADDDLINIVHNAECVLNLSAKFFVDEKALSGSIVIVSVNSHASADETQLLKTLHKGKKYSIMVKNAFRRHAKTAHFREKAKNYLLILKKKFELMKNLGQLSGLPSFNPLAKAIVYYKLKPRENPTEIAKAFINDLRKYKILKSMAFIYSPVHDEITTYSWTPYRGNNCAKKCEFVYVLDKCSANNMKQLESQREMFPLDLDGCPLITYAVISEPYVMPPIRKIFNTSWNDVYEFNRGGEINLMKIISEFTNMSLVIRMSDKPENWGKIYPNESATEGYGALLNDSIDMLIGNIQVTRITRKIFHPTVSYTQDEMTWCVPKARQAPTWDNLIKIFRWTTWLSTFMCVIVMGIIFHYWYYKENKAKASILPTNSILMTFCMLLGWTSNFEPKSSAFRILIFVWLFFSLNMGITYESFLRSFLMHPRFEKQISSENDLIRSGIQLGGRDIYRSYFETNNASSFYLYRKYNTTLFSEGIRRAALERNFAVVSSRRQAEYIDQNLGKGAQLIFCFPESNNLYQYGVVLLARKWFPLLERFNNIIRRVLENGLIDKWNKELFIHSVRSDGTSAILSLSIQHLLGAFMLIGILYGFSIIVFLGEIILGYIERKRGSWSCSTLIP